jgi:hypothetical protein
MFHHDAATVDHALRYELLQMQQEEVVGFAAMKAT